jgi:hypothetical protein
MTQCIVNALQTLSLSLSRSLSLSLSCSLVPDIAAIVRIVLEIVRAFEIRESRWRKISTSTWYCIVHDTTNATVNRPLLSIGRLLCGDTVMGIVHTDEFREIRCNRVQALLRELTSSGGGIAGLVLGQCVEHLAWNYTSQTAVDLGTLCITYTRASERAWFGVYNCRYT